jgi:hypothetical protein
MIKAFTSRSLAAIRLAIVFRRSANRPARVFAHMCVKPRNENVSGRPRPGPAQAPSPAVLDGEPPKLDQARLLGVELQAEPGETLHQVRVEPLGVSTMLKADNEVVGKPHDDHVTMSLPPSPSPGPKIEDMVEVDVGCGSSGVTGAEGGMIG